MDRDLESSHTHVHGDLWGNSWKTRLWPVGIAAIALILNATGLLTSIFGVDTALIVACAGGLPLAIRAAQALRSGQLNYDVTIAVAAIIAVAAGQYLAAGEVVLIVVIGEALEHWAMHSADHAIASLLSVQPEEATVIRNGSEARVPAADVTLTDVVLVRSGERVPVDGVVLDGQAAVDQSLVTGESVAALKMPGASVFGGSLVEQGALDIRPERVGQDTTAARIGRLVADARRRRPPIVRSADQWSRIFLPMVIGGAAAVYLMTGEVLRSVAVLLIACSCALVYAAPAAFAAALARLAREGTLVKGGDVLESLAQVTAVAFDKTGTLTEGRPSVREVIASPGFTEADVLTFAAAAESRSEHCLGQAIRSEAASRGLPSPPASQFVPQPGLGVSAVIGGREVRVGSPTFLRQTGASAITEFEKLLPEESSSADTHVFVSVDGHAAGLVLLHDAVRPDAAAAITALAGAGIRDVFMLSGDARPVAEAVAAEVGIAPDHVHAELLPADKLARLRDISNRGARVLMVGDGLNDAPALAAAQVGLAFGRGAAALSAEAAQVVVLEPRLTVLAELVKFARKTVRRVRFNVLVFAVFINLLAIVAAGLGYLPPAPAAILHQVLSLIVILSSVSLLVEGRSRSGQSRRPWSAVLTDATSWIETRWLSPFKSWTSRHRRELSRDIVALAIGAWAFSGVTVLGPGESAVVQRFGRLVSTDLGPGLHVRAPWPIEVVTRLSQTRVRVLEIGFRTPAGAAAMVARTDYEWNTSHATGGPVEQVPDENLVLTGDENLAELYAVIHYRVASPATFLFAARDGEAVVRMMAEGALRDVTASYALDALLTTDRSALEQRWAAALSTRLEHAGIGAEVPGIHLEDVHPPVDVVPAFRDVASAQEEQLMKVLQAEAYAKELIPKARGDARASLETAGGYAVTRIDRSQGDAERFLAQLSAPDGSGALTEFRLQLEALETILPGKRVVIVDDHSGGHRVLTFFDNGDLLKLLSSFGNGGEPDESFNPGKGSDR